MTGRIATEKRYVITSLPADSRHILDAVRTHWGIESGLYNAEILGRRYQCFQKYRAILATCHFM